MHHIDFLHVCGKKSGIFYRRVSSAVYRNNLTSVKHSITGCAIGNPFSDQFLFFIQSETPILRPGCQNNRLAFVLLCLGDNLFICSILLYRKNLFYANIRSEILCLLIEVRCKLKSGNLLNSRIIFDLRRVDNLPAIRRLF